MNRLQKARERGYLNAVCQPHLAELHSEWCWRLRVPVIWMERCSPRSRYGRVHLDLFTTRSALTPAGQGALRALAAPAAVSAHDACWNRVPVQQLEALAGAVLRAVNRPGNYQFDLPQPAPNQGPAKLLPFPELATA